MFHRRISASAASALILASMLLVCPVAMVAQRHGGHGMENLSGGPGRPDGVDDKDPLRDFHQVLAVQATSEQVAEFAALVKNTEAAQAQLQAFQQQLSSFKEAGSKEVGAAGPARRDTLDQALENVRSGNKRFQEGFSAAQKSGLKDNVKRLAKSDSDLEQEEKKLDQSLDVKATGPEVAAHAASLDQALTDFYNQELALGREMSITLASGQDLAFVLPQVKSPARIGNHTVAVMVSGELSQTAAAGGQRTFRLDQIADLSDLQQNITELARSQLDTSDRCGQRLSIRQATLTPADPVSVLVMKLHFERWTCMGTVGRQSATELAEGDGGVEIKLTAAVEKNALKVVAAYGRIDATGMLDDSLRTGSLGDDLRDKAAQLILSAMQAGSDFKVTLPPAVQNAAVIQSAKFQDAGVGGLSVLLDGQIEISNEQADQLASQLNQALSARGAGTPGAVPQLVTRPQ
jgi:hypothetical protein